VIEGIYHIQYKIWHWVDLLCRSLDIQRGVYHIQDKTWHLPGLWYDNWGSAYDPFLFNLAVLQFVFILQHYWRITIAMLLRSKISADLFYAEM
jgi:hypothetical protein